MPHLRNQTTAQFGTAVANNIALAQTLGAAGPVTINGALASGGVATLNPPQKVVITSAGNDSAVVFTVKGTDYSGNLLTETFNGGNVGAVTSKYIYATVTSIAASAATSSITIGVSGQVYSRWLILGAQAQHYQWKIRAFFPVGGSATYDIEATSDIEIMNQVGDFADDIVKLTAGAVIATTTDNTTPWMAIRLLATAGASAVTLRALESRTA